MILSIYFYFPIKESEEIMMKLYIRLFFDFFIFCMFLFYKIFIKINIKMIRYALKINKNLSFKID